MLRIQHVVIVFAVLAQAFLQTARAADKEWVIEAEKCPARQGKVYRDEAASGGKCAVVLLAAPGQFVRAAQELPPGDYVATAWVRVVPVDILHTLAVRFTAGGEGTTFGAIQFDAAPAYQPFSIRFFHPGGKAAFTLSASGETGFDGMRREVSGDEARQFDKLKPTNVDLSDPLVAGGGKTESVEDLEAKLDDPHVNQLKEFDYHVRCDRIVIRQLRPAPSAVSRVVVDKIHYLPGETVRASAHLLGGPSGGDYELAAFDVTEAGDRRPVFSKKLSLKPRDKLEVPFEFKLGDVEFGHELLCALLRDGHEVHSGREYFGVSRNVYRIGITASHGGQNKQAPYWTRERVSAVMDKNKQLYANYYEVFAWAPCDYSNLAPKREMFWSGQTQYPGSVTGFNILLEEGHKRGIKGITYGKSCAGGIDGFYYYQRHPDFFHHGAWGGPGTEAYNTFYLERMIDQDYGGWQHWASLWTKSDYDPVVEYGAKAIMDSIEMFGWDGVRWDGHFTGNMKLFKKIVNAKYPSFVHGYNIAFANPAGKIFLPPANAIEDFHECAKNHGLMMDESVRNWAHTNFSPGWTRPFYEAICREGDYMKRIDGLPLFITFDMATAQDRTFNVLCGLAAGERYTYLTSPGDFAFGPLPKFLTRFSAYVWDDTARVADPDKFVEIDVAKGPKDTKPWWRWSTWLRGRSAGSGLPEGHQQLLVDILNPPRYKQFCNRVQTPPGTMTDLSVRVKIPAGARLVRALHVSPDLVEGMAELKAETDGDACRVTIPRLRTWSIAVFEFAPAGEANLAWPAFPLTTPVKDAMDYFAKEKAQREKIAAEQQKKKSEAGIDRTVERKEPKKPYFLDYDKVYNVDAEYGEKLAKPDDLKVRRDGLLDIMHCHGVYSWLNPVENAMGLIGGGNYTPSWVDRVGFKLRQWGCMDGFPDDYEDLLSYDVLVLDNIHAVDLGIRRRVMIADYVKNGGSLLYFGGFFNLSMGAEHNTALAELLPVRLVKYHNIFLDDAKGLPLGPVKEGFFSDKIDWSKAGRAFCVDRSPVKEGVEVLAKVGDYPAIVMSRFGEGRVIAFLINPHGDYPPELTPYWESSQWPKVLASCLKELARGSETSYAEQRAKRHLNPRKPIPERLLVQAADMSAEAFTKALKDGMANMIDARNSRMLLRAAMENHGKIQDKHLFDRVIDAAQPYITKSFAEGAEKLARLHEGLLHDANEPVIRAGAFKILGIRGDASPRPLVEQALLEADQDIVRQALIALGRLKDAASIPAIDRYLARGGEQKLLAMGVLKRLGKKELLKGALPMFVGAIKERIHLKSRRRAVIKTLYGGVSFKLTKAQRRRAKADLDELTELEAQAKFDVAYFGQAMHQLSDQELATFMDFLVATEDDEITSLAYAVFARLDPAKAKRYREKLKDARLSQLRMLAEY